ncbi:MAG: hypothetical protein QOK31_1809 [Solirubrobacteraceae bacterium]|jgi:nucleoside-diphosphate-sugar epimerase|nr:hypothetical protein [Solirubrobacteraceae bacterium]
MTEPPVPRRVFVTGALGFIGRHLADRYRAVGAEICGVDLSADPARGVVAGDISRPGSWQAAAAGADLFVHTAALVSNTGTLEASWRLNVMGTRLALDAAAAAGTERFVHFSSIRAFSDRDYPDGVDEHHPVRTDGRSYVDTKVASEQVALQAHAAGEVACTIVRPGDAYGPGSRPWTIIPVELIRARQFLLPAMGQGLLSPVYVDNLLDGVVRAAGLNEAAGQVFVLTDGAGVSTREFFGHYYRMLGKGRPPVMPTAIASMLAAAAGAAARVRGQATEVSPDTMRYLARTGTYSIAKARKVLGYEPQVDLAEGMRRTETWLRARGLLDP